MFLRRNKKNYYMRVWDVPFSSKTVNEACHMKPVLSPYVNSKVLTGLTQLNLCPLQALGSRFLQGHDIIVDVNHYGNLPGNQY